LTRWRGAVPVIAGVQASALALLASIAVDDELEVRLMGCGALPLALAAMEAHLGAAPLWAGGPSSGAACTRHCGHVAVSCSTRSSPARGGGEQGTLGCRSVRVGCSTT
jgi:hypothetical protein